MIKYLDLKAVNSLYDEEIRSAVSRVLDCGWYLKGEATRRFEQHYAEYIGTRYCIGCGNGLDALTLIFRAYMEMGVMQRGDEVIVPANTYIASILAITECGLKPILVEPSWETLQQMMSFKGFFRIGRKQKKRPHAAHSKAVTSLFIIGNGKKSDIQQILCR